MTGVTREELIETIEVTVVELRGVAQPHEVATLRELALDAAEAEDEEQLALIARQVDSLRTFCMGRAKSSAALQLALPRLPRRHA
jgi:hypothetical protein